jgi:hypothetical protein
MSRRYGFLRYFCFYCCARMIYEALRRSAGRRRAIRRKLPLDMPAAIGDPITADWGHSRAGTAPAKINPWLVATVIFALGFFLRGCF